uniref:Adhesion G protein-coupled receptor B3 n=1 Tax=Eptatretus burgeri TaxID=7764 RepID=A0A8C4PWR2_EPTBU
MLAANHTADITFPLQGRRRMVDWARNLDDHMIIPKSVISNLPTEPGKHAIIGNILYKNIGQILPISRNSSYINSRMFALTINPAPKRISPPLEIVFSHLNNATNDLQCMVWNYTNLPAAGAAWPGSACNSNGNINRGRRSSAESVRSTCYCDQLAAFAILSASSHHGIQENMSVMETSSFPLVIGCGVSSLSLMGLMVIYCIFWRTIKSERSVILLNFCVSIISSNSLIVVGQAQLDSKVICTVIAAFLHFFFLASFCWVLTEAWQSYLAVNGQQRSKIVRKRFLCLGWGLPALIVAISVGFTKTKGYGTTNYCWLSLEGGLLYAFVGPAAGVVLVNMGICILVFNKLVSKEGIHDKKLKHHTGPVPLPHAKLKCSKCGIVSGNALSASTTSNAMASLWSSCVVLPLLALTWMSAVLAITDRRSSLFQILFAVFDSLQGFVVLVVHSILRKEVQDALKCRIQNTNVQTNETSSTFQNGHAEILSDFEKDVEMVCRSVLSKDGQVAAPGSGLPCEEHTLIKPDYSSNSIGLSGLLSILPDVQPQPAPTLTTSETPATSMNPPDLPSGYGNADPSQLYCCSTDALELFRAHERAISSNYVLLPCSTQAPGMNTLPPGGSGSHDIPATEIGHLGPSIPKGTDPLSSLTRERHRNLFRRPSLNVEHPPPLRACYGTLTRDSPSQALRADTASTVSLNSLERRKCKYSELDFEKIMRTRKRHIDMFQDLNNKFQQDKDDRGTLSVDMLATADGQGQHSTSTEMTSVGHGATDTLRKVIPVPASWSLLDPSGAPCVPADLTNAEWEKAGSNLPLATFEGDIQTEV